MTARLPSHPATPLARLQHLAEHAAAAGANPFATVPVLYDDLVAVLDALDLVADASRHATMRSRGRGDVSAETIDAVLAELGARRQPLAEPPPLRPWPTNPLDAYGVPTAAPEAVWGRFATPTAPVVVAFHTRAEGLVFRWYAAVEDYAAHRPLCLAHRHRAYTLADACDEATFLAALVVVDELAEAYRGYVVDDAALNRVAAGATHKPLPVDLRQLVPIEER